MSHLHQLTEKGLAHPPRWLTTNVQYETIMGSQAYGVADDTSDFDIYGWAIPYKDDLFPHLRGEIPGFGRQHQRFEQYQQHHIFDRDAMNGAGRSYDFTIFSIVKYFQLATENNPNIIDSLFTAAHCVLHTTRIGQLVRERRRLFLHKGAWHKFKGYAYAQLNKLQTKNPTGKRADLVAAHGYDTKFAYHVVRLLGEVEQILSEGDLDLCRDAPRLKTIRRGEWSEKDVRDWFSAQEKALESLYVSSKLPYSPDETAIRQLLIDCLETHYGSLSCCLVQPDRASRLLESIRAQIDAALAPIQSAQGTRKNDAASGSASSSSP